MMIVFFDGVCGLCNRFISFLIGCDKLARLRFAPLQGETARNTLGAVQNPDLETIVFWDQGKQYVYSDAVIEIITRLGGLGSLARVFRIIPRSFRDWLYRFVARNRFRWFRRLESCPIPPPELRGRFLP